MAHQKIVFVNIAWMKDYKGPKGDKAEGGFRFMKENPDAIVHESWNFKPIKNRIYGYIPRSTQADITNLGAQRDDDKIDGITVVWVSRNPRQKKTVIVGWYKNATVYKLTDHFRFERTIGLEVGYQIEVLQENATLLPVDARYYPIPTTGKGKFGQSPVWYGKDAAFNRDVLAYIGREGQDSPTKPKPPRQSDPELRRKVEQAAINHAIAHFESAAGGNRIVRSVEKDNVGWDLEATGVDEEVLKIEVKGLSGKDLVLELTPNEYAQMRSPDHRKHYIIYVLLEALQTSAKAQIFRHDAINSKRDNLLWSNDDGEVLIIEPRLAARLSLTR